MPGPFVSRKRIPPPMVRIAARMLAVVAAVVFAAACARGSGSDHVPADAARPDPGGTDAMRDYVGDPYLGSVDVRILRPGADAGDAITDAGRGSAQFIDRGDGKVRLVVVGDIQAEGDAGFAVDGVHDASGWTSRVDGVLLEIGADGSVSGGGEADPHRFRFDGSVSRDRVALQVDIELMEKSGSGFPAGTRFVFDYTLRRYAVDATAQQGTGERAAGCKRIVYRLRTVPNFSGGPMGTVRVPRCIPADH